MHRYRHNCQSPRCRCHGSTTSLGPGRPAQAAVRPRPRLPRLALRLLHYNQQLSQDLKIPTKDPQPHVPTVAAEGLISTPIQTIARLQRAQLPTRSPGDAAVPGGIPQWPLAPDAEPKRGLAWASTAALPVSPTRVDSPENESRDRTTHVGFDRSVVVSACFISSTRTSLSSAPRGKIA